MYRQMTLMIICQSWILVDPVASDNTHCLQRMGSVCLYLLLLSVQNSAAAEPAIDHGSGGGVISCFLVLWSVVVQWRFLKVLMIPGCR